MAEEPSFPVQEVSSPTHTAHTGTAAVPATQSSSRIWQVSAVVLLLVVVGLGAYLFGRGAPEALCEAADTVSELRDVKHAFRAGVRAQKGVDL